ncbi:MAG: SIR2 family protein [Rufibacter sp.]
MKQTSLLLGAGFSVNQGYPTASQLNEALVNLHPEDFWIHTDGTGLFKSRDEKDPCWYDSYAKGKYFITRLINFYIELTKEGFNYEEFYDFYNEIYRQEKEVKEFNEFCDSFRVEFHSNTDNLNLLSQTNQIFNQLITHFLVDREGNRFYKPVHLCKPIYPGYTGFLNCLEFWGTDGTVHIHTLNHDIFFEIFNNSDWLQGNLCDGFNELGSPYFGDFKEDYKVRLPYFTNEYKEKFRLYKLHGSIDQFPFHIQDNGIQTYVKIKYGVGNNGLYKEVNQEGELTYINDWINYHSDFLSGTTSKILRYREPWYYEKVFTHFENNLEASERLIAIGYGCGDLEVNNIIEQKFDFNNKPVYVVDPYPSERTTEFIKKFNGKLVEKTPENIQISDFE